MLISILSILSVFVLCLSNCTCGLPASSFSTSILFHSTAYLSGISQDSALNTASFAANLAA